MDADLREAIDFIDRDHKTGDYIFAADLVVHGINAMPGYRESESGKPSSDEKDRAVLDAYIVHQINEYARLNSVAVRIVELRNKDNGYPFVWFTGSFSAVYDLYLNYNDLTDAKGDRDIIRAAIDAKPIEE